MKGRINITFCTYFKDLSKFRYEHEVYDEYVAFCLGSGSFCYRIDSSPDKILSAGEIVICPPGKRFFRKSIEECCLCMIKFKSDEELSVSADAVKVGEGMRFEYDLMMLSECLFCGDMDNNPAFEHFCRDILFLAFQSNEKEDVFALAGRYIRENYRDAINVADMASKSGYSQVHFINRFKANYGMSPKQYALEVRLRKAKELLLTTDRSSKEIAYMCGFSDELYFLRFFKKRTGLTTSAFRKNTV